LFLRVGLPVNSKRPCQPIFQESNGIAVKFFIQKDLTTELQAELCETITVGITDDTYLVLPC
jgi:hypothetical protein